MLQSSHLLILIRLVLLPEEPGRKGASRDQRCTLTLHAVSIMCSWEDNLHAVGEDNLHAPQRRAGMAMSLLVGSNTHAVLVAFRTALMTNLHHGRPSYPCWRLHMSAFSALSLLKCGPLHNEGREACLPEREHYQDLQKCQRICHWWFLA